MTMKTSIKALRLMTALALLLISAQIPAFSQNAGRPPVPPQGASRTQTQGQDAGKASVRTDYIDADEMPDASVFLPAPPKPGDPLFDSDLVYYEWGKSMRPTERGQRAQDDAKSSLDYLAQILEPAVGVRISNEQTPNLYRLLSKSMTTANNANRKAKDFYKRTRPYVEFDEPTGVPEEERGSRRSASYPSGHTTRGWTVALVLSELLPDKASEILKVGYEYVTSRVIVGFHYETDVQAARTAASGAVAVMHSDKEFQKDMKKARKELARLGLR